MRRFQKFLPYGAAALCSILYNILYNIKDSNMMLWIMINSILYNSPCDKEGEEPGVLISKSDFEDDNWPCTYIGFWNFWIFLDPCLIHIGTGVSLKNLNLEIKCIIGQTYSFQKLFSLIKMVQSFWKSVKNWLRYGPRKFCSWKTSEGHISVNFWQFF